MDDDAIHLFLRADLPEPKHYVRKDCADAAVRRAYKDAARVVSRAIPYGTGIMVLDQNQAKALSAAILARADEVCPKGDGNE